MDHPPMTSDDRLTMLEAGTASQLLALIVLSSTTPADLLPVLETLGISMREVGYTFRPSLILSALYPGADPDLDPGPCPEPSAQETA